MALSKYKDFLELGRNSLVDILAVHGLNKSGKKVELVARAFAAVDMNLPILASSVEQQAKLKIDYENRLKKFNICDPESVSVTERSNDILKWPKIDVGAIFSYILKVRDFDYDYIGRYKDQKAYSYFYSGFVDSIYTHHPVSNKDDVFLYCKAQASVSVFVTRNLWILVKNCPVDILTSWCSCMAGTSQCCNHVIATLYKIDYALRQGYLDPSCTSVPCSWNKSSKKEVKPKQIKEIVVRKRFRSKEKDKPSREEVRKDELTKFNPILPAYREKTDEEVSMLFKNLYRVTPQSAVFLCIPVDDSPEKIESFILQNVANKVIEDPGNDTYDKKISSFLQSLPVSSQGVLLIEKKTRGQAENDNVACL
eukprot:gene15949-7279_t